MAERLVGYVLQYGVYSLEVGLLVFLLWRDHWRRLAGVFLYVLWFLALDGIGRPYVLYRYGLTSREYAYFFWLSDVVLTLAAFLLVCAFFRRACAQEEKMWRFLRLMLVFVFILVLGISLFSLSRNYSQLLTQFIIEFSQNLYFTCLVLNTLLYLLMQQIESADEELGLLVCGMGIQYAGSAAGWALVHLTSGEHFAQSLQNYIMPLCTLVMLLTWFYAIARATKGAPVSAQREGAVVLAHAGPQV